MFGYIRPFKDELKMREYRLYRSYYCGFCKFLGMSWGPFSRLFLNHDFVFLNLLLSSMEDGEEKGKWSRCLLHPFRFFIIESPTIFRSTAPFNLFLIYQKLENNRRSGFDVKSFLPRLLLQGKMKGIFSSNPGLISLMMDELSSLKEREETGCDDLDLASEPFARLLGHLFYDCNREKKEKRILHWLGFNLGKWIYLLDAYDDLKEDHLKGEYNPFFSAYHFQGGNLIQFRQRIQQDVLSLLRICHYQMIQSFYLLDLKKNRGLLENILYLGLPQQMEEIVFEGGCEGGKGSISGPWYKKRCL